jgi:hypothetical protein
LFDIRYSFLFLTLAVVLPVADGAAGETDHITRSVTFHSSDSRLQTLHDNAVEKIQRHLIEYAPGFKVLANSGDYTGLFLENAALNGENYARFDPQFALNNVRAFFMTQREDGKFPNVIWPGYRMRERPRKLADFTPVIPELDGAVANYGGINGICFPYHAWRVYFWTGKDRDYLQQLYRALEKYDGFLWNTRDSDGDGLLELWCMFDSGEDHSSRLMTRYAPANWPIDIPPGAPAAPVPTDAQAYRSYWIFHARDKIPPPAPEEVLVPFESMDVNAYSHAARDALALISAELGNGKAGYWRKRAEEVRERVKERLWVEEKHACYDLDRQGRRNPELIHNNLRAMYYGVFTQEMADAFIRHHLLNPEEFWTPTPIPSIAINEPLFKNVEGNNWSGQVQALTLSRGLHALEKYGHYAEVSLLGERLIATWTQNEFCFTQQIDPFTGINSGLKADYNVAMTATCLAYLPRMFGIYPVVDQQKIWWSALSREGSSFQTSQRSAELRYDMVVENGRVRGLVNGKPVFSCSEGVRIVTDEEGSVREVIGISPKPIELELVIGERRVRQPILPNAVYELRDNGLIQVRVVPFDYPHHPLE